ARRGAGAPRRRQGASPRALRARQRECRCLCALRALRRLHGRGARQAPSTLPARARPDARAAAGRGAPGGGDRPRCLCNNWLLATNPAPRLSAAEIAAVTARLTAAYPDAAVVFRSVNPRLDPDG